MKTQEMLVFVQRGYDAYNVHQTLLCRARFYAAAWFDPNHKLGWRLSLRPTEVRTLTIV